MIIEKIDETIVTMCNEIQKEMEEKTIGRYEMIPDIVSALAKLISARAEISENHSIDFLKPRDTQR